MSGPQQPSQARDTYLTPRQAASLLGVCSRTVTRWADLGHLPFITTLGGHRRFRESDVLALRRHG
ncbi:MAG: helix-turn-helix domain-containing protein [Acidimicrobiales bacterium]